MGILPRCSVHPGGRGGGTEASGWDGAIEDRDGGLGVGCTWPCRTSAVGGGVADRYWHSELKRRYCRALSFLTRMIPGQVIAPRHGTCILPYSVRRIHKLYMDKVTQEHLYMACILNVSLTHTFPSDVRNVLTSTSKPVLHQHSSAVPAVFLRKG